MKGIEFGIKFNMTPVWWSGRTTTPLDVGTLVLVIMAKWPNCEVRVTEDMVRVSKRFPPDWTVAAIQRQATELRSALDLLRRIVDAVPAPVRT